MSKFSLKTVETTCVQNVIHLRMMMMMMMSFCCQRWWALHSIDVGCGSWPRRCHEDPAWQPCQRQRSRQNEGFLVCDSEIGTKKPELILRFDSNEICYILYIVSLTVTTTLCPKETW